MPERPLEREGVPAAKRGMEGSWLGAGRPERAERDGPAVAGRGEDERGRGDWAYSAAGAEVESARIRIDRNGGTAAATAAARVGSML